MKRHVPGPWSNPQVYLLPNLMTAGNLACGFSAVLTIFNGMQRADAKDFHLAIFLILGACFFDALDGRLARIKGQDSMFGREFDSLADIVSFGMAPALLVMDIVLSTFDNRLGWTIAFVYLLCGAMRLARFNCLAQMAAEAPPEERKKNSDFVGFPIPAAAGLIASLTIFILWLNEGSVEIGAWRYVLLALMLLLSFMMLSEFHYPSFKAMNWRARRSMPWLFVAILLLVCAVNFVEFVPLGIFLAYFVYGLVRPWISRKWRKEIEEVIEGGDVLEDPGDEEETVVP